MACCEKDKVSSTLLTFVKANLLMLLTIVGVTIGFIIGIVVHQFDPSADALMCLDTNTMSEALKNIIHHTDDGGGSLEVQEYQGSYYPATFDAEVIQNYHLLDIRQDDIILANYPKSGTHWFWEIMSQLVAGKAESIRDTWKGELMVECAPAATIDAAPSPRILNTHIRFEQLPRGIVEKKCKIVYGLRNPKDLAVSFYNHHNALKYMYKYDGEWKDYLSLFKKGLVDWGSWFDNVFSYINAKQQHPELSILVMYYEDMIQNPVSGVRQLADFLGVEADDQLCRDIAHSCRFDNMKAVATEMGRGLIQDGVPRIFRKGGVGDWKNWFTVAQNEEFDKFISEKLDGHNIPFKYSL